MTNHWWSGWPGAYCLKCGAEDPNEIALADVPMDYDTGDFIWPTPEREQEYKDALFCPVEDDPEKHPWLKHG